MSKDQVKHNKKSKIPEITSEPIFALKDFFTSKASHRKQLSVEEKDILREKTVGAINTKLATALENDRNYFDFIRTIGYDPFTMPPYSMVESIIIDGDNICINEIPKELEIQNDSESET